MWPQWGIYRTLGNFLKPLATIYLPKSLTFLGNVCKDVKIFNFSIEIIFGQHLATFYWSHSLFAKFSHLKLKKITILSFGTGDSQCDRIGWFFEVLCEKFTHKVAQMDGDFLAIFKNITFQVKSTVGNLFGVSLRKFGLLFISISGPTAESSFKKRKWVEQRYATKY